jgi:hypothetical protein
MHHMRDARMRVIVMGYFLAGSTCCMPPGLQQGEIPCLVAASAGVTVTCAGLLTWQRFAGSLYIPACVCTQCTKSAEESGL